MNISLCLNTPLFYRNDCSEIRFILAACTVLSKIKGHLHSNSSFTTNVKVSSNVSMYQVIFYSFFSNKNVLYVIYFVILNDKIKLVLSDLNISI